MLKTHAEIWKREGEIFFADSTRVKFTLPRRTHGFKWDVEGVKKNRTLSGSSP